MPSLPAWNPRTVSLPLSGGLSTVFPRLIPWLIQMTLAAQPIPGNRWVLWRLRPHPGICTPAAYQLRRSCVAACWSNVVRRYPVRSLHPLAGGWLGPAGSMDRSVWSILHPLRLYTRLRTGLQAGELSPSTTSTDTSVRERFTRGGLFPACFPPPPLARFPSQRWQGEAGVYRRFPALLVDEIDALTPWYHAAIAAHQRTRRLTLLLTCSMRSRR